MMPNRDEINDHVRQIEKHSYQSTTSEAAMKGIEEGAREIERLAGTDRAGELARGVRQAVEAQRQAGIKRRIYTTSIGEKIEQLQEYVEMNAEQPLPPDRPGTRP
jgi:hypothetical protein